MKRSQQRQQSTKDLESHETHSAFLNGSATSTIVESISRLDSDERKEKSDCESQFSKGFFAMCNAVLRIREKRLYREEYHTFEAYSEAVLGLSRIHGHRLAEAGRVLQLLSPISVTPLPSCERQVRPLTMAPPHLVPIIWQRAIDRAGTGRITSNDVEVAFVETAKEKQLPQSARPRVNDADVNLSYLEDTLLSIVREMARFIKAHKLENVEECIERLRLRLEVGNQSIGARHEDLRGNVAT